MLASTVKPLAEVLADRLRLGGRFDDHQGVPVAGRFRFGGVLLWPYQVVCVKLRVYDQFGNL